MLFYIYYARVLKICVYIRHKYLAYICVLGHYQWICSFGKCHWIICLKSTWRQWKIASFISWLVYSTLSEYLLCTTMLDYGNTVTSNIQSCLQKCCSLRRVSGPKTLTKQCGSIGRETYQILWVIQKSTPNHHCWILR